ncbi:hypothetical protein FJY90_05540 [Candidatus Gottesmanbacteria bacterium]|nr:hypothetical protein [Candidatus Gottesmanbacteria bacterium]
MEALEAQGALILTKGKILPSGQREYLIHAGEDIVRVKWMPDPEAILDRNFASVLEEKIRLPEEYDGSEKARAVFSAFHQAFSTEDDRYRVMTGVDAQRAFWKIADRLFKLPKEERGPLLEIIGEAFRGVGLSFSFENIPPKKKETPNP